MATGKLHPADSIEDAHTNAIAALSALVNVHIGARNWDAADRILDLQWAYCQRVSMVTEEYIIRAIFGGAS